MPTASLPNTDTNDNDNDKRSTSDDVNLPGGGLLAEMVGVQQAHDALDPHGSQRRRPPPCFADENNTPTGSVGVIGLQMS